MVLASEPVCICGVDVAAPQQLRMRGKQRMSVAELKAVFAKQFTPYEARQIRQQYPLLESAGCMHAARAGRGAASRSACSAGCVVEPACAAFLPAVGGHRGRRRHQRGAGGGLQAALELERGRYLGSWYLVHAT